MKTLKYLTVHIDTQTLGNSLLNSIHILHGFESSSIIQTIGEVIQEMVPFQILLVYRSEIFKSNSYRIIFKQACILILRLLQLAIEHCH